MAVTVAGAAVSWGIARRAPMTVPVISHARAAAVGTSGSDDTPVPSAGPAPSTVRMGERLAAIAEAADRVTDTSGAVPAFGTNRPALVPVLRARLAGLTDPTQVLVARYELATQLMLAGESREALAQFEALPPLLASLDLPPAQMREEEASLQGAIGLAALRLGEQENCLLNHRATSCLFPIDQAGRHTLRDGSSRAARAFARQLELQPQNLGARWLLNLAHMTLGTHSEDVAAASQLPMTLFRSDHDVPRFTDVAARTGLDVVGLAGGCVLEDLDGDGDLDVMVSSWGLRDQLRLLRNDGAAGFVDRTEAAGLAGEWGGINLTHADYDNDGDADVFVHRGGWLGEAGLIPNSLLRNDGGLRFTDVTDAAGLYSEHPTHAAAWGDYDNDGWLDLFVANEDAGSGRHPVQLYRNRGDGTFTDVAPALGFGVLGLVKGAAWGDYDNDGWLDLYVSRYGRANLLYHNEPDGTGDRRRFTEVAAGAGVAEPALSFATWFFDYDNDGWLDLFVGGWSSAPVAVAVAEYLGHHTPEGTPRLFRN
ncbi:MAG: FG-GAP repeat domain-containing protein, partial [Vicinamibacterales bacterium]